MSGWNGLADIAQQGSKMRVHVSDDLRGDLSVVLFEDVGGGSRGKEDIVKGLERVEAGEY